MKKSLLALAVLGTLAGAAVAQSSVTIYGRLDLGLVKESGQSTRIDSTNGANRLGFRGVEDLGGGLRALFDIQHRFSPESGGQDGTRNQRPFWQGQSFVGLAGGFGTVTLGRQLTALQGPINATDPWGTETVASVAALSSGYATDARQPDGAGTGRTDVINYSTPRFGGFGAAVSLGPKRSAAVAPATTGAEHLFSLWASYAAGPLMIGAGMEQNRSDDDVVAVLGSYDLGMVKLMAGYSQIDTVALTGSKGRNWNLGLTAPFGPVLAKLGYSQRKAERTGVDTDKIGIGADYALSKRTKVYTGYGRSKTDRQPATNGFDLGVSHTF